MAKLKVKILDTAAGAAMFKELGLMEAGTALFAGDYMGAINIFYNRLANILMTNGIDGVLKIIMKYGVVKWVTSAIPGTGKTFSFLGLVDIEL